MKKENLRISVIQDNPTVGCIDSNINLTLAHLHREAESDLVVFPECFLTGYPLADLVLRPGFLSKVSDGIAKIKEDVVSLNGPAVLIGAPLAGASLPYNAAYLIEPSGSVRIVRKHELPNNDVFDERRTFAMSDERPPPLSFRGFNLGIQICEDMWHGGVSRSLADELAEVLIVLNGSPYQGGKQKLRRDIAKVRVSDTGLPLIYANLTGGQDELVFDGGSFVMNTSDGYIEAQSFMPDVMHLNISRDESGRAEIHFEDDFEMKPYPVNQTESDYNAAVLALRDYIRKTNMGRAVIGVSGGLDSAIVLAMAVDAIGADHVVGVMMPSEFTGKESLDLADDLMSRLGVHKATLPIDNMLGEVRNSTEDIFAEIAGRLSLEADLDITRENFQARLRGMALMGLTNAIGGVVLSTGNKSEMSVGYATLYGDMSGGYNPLKSVYKSEAFRMAEWRNAQSSLIVSDHVVSNPIPEGIITRPPSAELAEDQTDQASLGDYDLLDTVLKSLIEDKSDARTASRALEVKYSFSEILRRTGGYNAVNYAEKISSLVRCAQYKRDQSCPGVKLNLTDFGLGWRYPIAGQYEL